MPADHPDLPEIQRLIQNGDWASGVILLRKVVAADPSDIRSLKLLGAALLRLEDLDGAIEILTRSVALQPNSYASLVNLANALVRTNRHRASSEYFRRAMALAPSEADRIQLALSLAEAEAHGVSFAAALDAFVSLGLLSPQHAAALNDGPEAQLDQIDERVLVRVQQVAVTHKEHAIARRLGLRLRQRGSKVGRGEVLSGLLAAQMRLGLREEAAATYLDGLERGDPVLDYRPRFDNASLTGANQDLAGAVYKRDRDTYAAWLATVQSTKAPPPYADAEKQTSAFTDGGEPVGLNAVVVWGRVSASSPGARYRIEYGLAPAALNAATEWKTVPPPLRGHIRERAYRIFGDWIPRSTKFGWSQLEEGDLPQQAGRYAMRLESPFAKDRNQLSGIGSHEMPLNIGWCHERGEFNSPSFSAGGGILDLRDAQVSFTVMGENLDQRGSTLHFWIGRKTRDDRGDFTSQWALTGYPFPDRALTDGAWHRVTLALASNPQLWTYTGNNPKEQGIRANRYRRAPLEDNIEQANDPFILIFAFGAERRPPAGALNVYDVTLAYRDYSIVSNAAGAKLVASPASDVDPRNLTNGSRGFDELMWVSNQHPAFPLDFEWALARPAKITHIQLNQHPYYPAKDVAVDALDESGRWSPMWAGRMPNGRPDSGEQPFAFVRLTATSPVVGIRLRLLSGYGDERCGLDGIEIYGSGALFTPDGEPCSVCSEIPDLKAGSRIYARLVVEDGGHLVVGGVKDVTLPPSRAPQILGAEAWLRGASLPCLVVRGNACGLDSSLSATLKRDNGESVRFEAISFGQQPTARHIYFNLPAQVATMRGMMLVELANSEGTDRREVSWPPVGDAFPTLLRAAMVDASS